MLTNILNNTKIRQVEMCRILGISRSALLRWMDGVQPVSPETKNRCAKYFLVMERAVNLGYLPLKPEIKKQARMPAIKDALRKALTSAQSSG